MPALIKVKETGQINQHFYVEKYSKMAQFCEKKQNVCAQLIIFSPKGSFSSSSLTRGTPYSLIKVSSFQVRYLLSNLNGWFSSYLWTTKGCQSRYFLLAPIY